MNEEIERILTRCADEIICCEDFKLEPHEKYSVDIYYQGLRFELSIRHAVAEVTEQ